MDLKSIKIICFEGLKTYTKQKKIINLLACSKKQLYLYDNGVFRRKQF